MARVEKTVFISYRRTNSWTALAIYQHLTQHGFDVFMDYQGVAAGDFETQILENVRARAHFLILLTPSALEHLAEPGDWLRREIEAAIESRRNIVPVMFEGFDFGSPAVAKHLTGALSILPRYQGLSLPVEYFEAAMERLRSRYLNVSLEDVGQPPSPAAQGAAQMQSAAASAAPAVEDAALTAEQWFERGVRTTDNQDKLRIFSEAIGLKPDFAFAYLNRGNARLSLNDPLGAIGDYGDFIRLQPDDIRGYHNRAAARRMMGDWVGAITDYNDLIRLYPNDPSGYFNRAEVHREQKHYASALEDYRKSHELQNEHAAAHPQPTSIKSMRRVPTIEDLIQLMEQKLRRSKLKGTRPHRLK